GTSRGSSETARIAGDRPGSGGGRGGAERGENLAGAKAPRGPLGRVVGVPSRPLASGGNPRGGGAPGSYRPDRFAGGHWRADSDRQAWGHPVSHHARLFRGPVSGGAFRLLLLPPGTVAGTGAAQGLPGERPAAAVGPRAGLRPAAPAFLKRVFLNWRQNGIVVH